MSYEHKPGSFALFKNDKGGVETRPDYRGEGKDMDGNDIRVVAWIRDSSKGKFMSCKFEPKEEREPARKPAPSAGRRTGGMDEMDDDIPF